MPLKMYVYLKQTWEVMKAPPLKGELQTFSHIKICSNFFRLKIPFQVLD